LLGHTFIAILLINDVSIARTVVPSTVRNIGGNLSATTDVRLCQIGKITDGRHILPSLSSSFRFRRVCLLFGIMNSFEVSPPMTRV
jgi:hypothetical protein